MPDIHPPSVRSLTDSSSVAGPRRITSRRDARPDDWRASAACLTEDPELFFPVGSVGPYLDQVEQARSVCRDCPVQRACLEFALEIGAHGVWGGQSEDERRRLARHQVRR